MTVTAPALTLPRRRTRRRFDPVLAVTAVLCALLVLLAVLGPFLAPYDPRQTDVLAADTGPSATHPLGTDALGRDILSRALSGATLTLLGPAVVVLAATLGGTALALVMAWYGGRTDTLLNRVLDILLAFPSLLFAILAVGVFGTGLTAPVAALSLAYIPFLARVIRSAAVRQRHLPYVEACLVAGFSTWRINARHLLPALWPLIRAQATIAFASALVDLAAISFIGLGARPPATDWGLMISEGRASLLNGSPQETLVAGALIVLTVVTVNVLGERLAQRAEVPA
ncbi:ABC transporter permease [Streptomyces sp. NPDC002088]|uniref:ABC transporter permease n=1 Tax=Streptomyces sp. NPDC002088 TaxID=3154665 RepID=UPI00332F69CD